MLRVFATSWCPHCRRTIRFLIKNHIDFCYLDIEYQQEETIREVIAANGGKNWVVPTLEFNGKWRPGKPFDQSGLMKDLQSMGVIP